MCGNSVLDGGEACDQGSANRTVGSCCASDCQFEPATTERPAAATFCDVAETCTGISDACPADSVKPAGTLCRLNNDCVGATCDGVTAVCPPSAPTSPDDDGDGLCGAIDGCTNVGGAQDFLTDAKVPYSSRRTQRKLLGTFVLPAGSTFADLDPIARRATLVERTDDSLIATTGLPAGAFDGSRGWRRSRTKGPYVDRNASPVDGVTRVPIADRRQQLGLITVKLKARGGRVLPADADLPLYVAFAPGDRPTDAAAGRCGEAAFQLADCRGIHRDASTFTCTK